MPAVRGSLRRHSRLSHPAVRGSSRRRSRLSDPAVRGSWCRRSRLSHPAIRGSSRRRSRINQPTVRRRWPRRPRLTLNARRPASDSMPAGLPLTQCPPDRRWLKPAGSPLTQARRIAADSSPPERRWLKPAGSPLTHARWPPFAGKANSPRPQYHAAIRGSPTPPFVGDHAAVRGESQPAVRGHSARRRLWLPPARRPPPLCGQASRLWSYQPAVAVFDQTVTKVFLSHCFRVCFAPEGSGYPWAAPWIFFWGGTNQATAMRDHLPWPPELPAPPWPPSVCSALEAPSCVCLCVGPVGSPECPPPLPGSTVTARDAPSGRGELCQTSVVCVLCSRLFVSLYGLFPVLVSCHY